MTWRDRAFSPVGAILEALAIGIGLFVIIYACWGMAIVVTRASGILP